MMKMDFCINWYRYVFLKIYRAADIHSVKISGIAKNALYQVGNDINPSRLKSQWNAVVIDGKWRLIDVLWSSRTEATQSKSEGKTKTQSVTRRTNEFFFLTDPEFFIYTHLPDDSKWQLLRKKVSLEDFERMPYLRERFFDMELTLTDDSHHTVVVETLTGELFFQFGKNPSRTKDEFRHKINKIKGSTTADDRQVVGTDKLENAVSVILHPGELRFHLHLPEHGRYRFEIFGRDRTNPYIAAFDIVCSYILEYSIDGHSCLEIRFFFKEPSEHARFLRRGEASEWLKKKGATLKVMGHEMILSIATPPGPNAIKHLVEDYEKSNHLAPAIIRSMLYITPKETNLPEAHDVPNGRADWKIANMKIKICSHINGLVRTIDGKVKVKISASDNAEIWYEFHTDNRTRGVEGTVEVIIKHEVDCTSFTIALSLNEPRNYLLSLFARAKTLQNKFYHVKTYRIQYELLDCV